MNSDKTQLKYIRGLILCLTTSGILNIVLLASLFYWLAKDTPPSPYFEQKPAVKKEQQVPLAIDNGNRELIHYFRSLSFHQLANKLSNNQLIENGYTLRDIALASLVAFHHFDLTKALVGYNQADQQRSIVYARSKSGKPISITVYPALSDQQFQAIMDFISTERWPFTSKGLFYQMKKLGEHADPSLIDAFSMTPEFLAVEILFNRSDASVNKDELQKLVMEGSWAALSEFAEHQKLVQDLSPARRQRFLLEYIDRNSKSAAYLMLKADEEFALKKLDDQHVITLLSLLSDQTTDSEKYARELLVSPRSDAVWKMAATKLYQYAGETLPEKNFHHLAMKRFLPNQVVKELSEKPKPQKIPSKPVVAKSEPIKQQTKKATITKQIVPTASKPVKKDRLYIVQEGDSLWKISRRFSVNIDTLRKHNKLKSDSLKPGTPIRIP